MEFSKLQLPDELEAALTKLKITTPTPVQSEAIPKALEGVDLIAIAQTGTGKTLAYALPTLAKLLKDEAARALILLPSRETAEQVYRVMLSLTGESKMSVCLAASGVPEKELVSKLKKNPRVIIATPGRLNEQLQNNKLLLKGLQVLVIDEADRMIDEGFKPDLVFIKSTLRGSWQTMMFAASFGGWCKPIAEMFMKPDPVMIRAAEAERPVTNLEQKVYFLTKAQKQNRLIDELRKLKSRTIIFADSKESCVAIGRLLGYHGFSSDFIHGDMNPGHRNRILREFREGKIQVVVTTDLLARGLDIPDLEHVINYDLPYKAEDFLHRIGRTARAGKEGTAITFVTPGDGRTYRKIKVYLENATEEKLSSTFKFSDQVSK